MKSYSQLMAAATLAGLFLATTSDAQPIVAEHYPAGVEGIKGASLPPPGLYFRDYNVFYTANNFKNEPLDFKMFGYVQAPRLIWMTPLQFLGASYGMDVLLTFDSMNYKLGGWHNYVEFGDTQIEPLLLSWHLAKLDVAAGYAVWAPTGDFDVHRVSMISQGFWSHMLTLGATWYVDSEKTIALSVLNRYEIGQEQQDTHHTPGQVFTMEASLSKTVMTNLDLGVTFYYQQQTTKDSGAAVGLDPLLDRKFGIGPEISGVCPVLGVIASVRYAYEFGAQDRPQGHLVTLTLTKRF